jgi:spoIIIJ-associated protein
MQENATEKLKTIITTLLSHMGFEAEVFERQEEGRTVFNIKARDAQLLIGKLGANLDALQHIVRIMYRKQTQEDSFPFALDVDDYKDQRSLYLKDLARRAAQHVRNTRKPVALEPMPSHERRIIHSYLSLYSDIGSESTGVEPRRKLIIRLMDKPKDKDGFNFIENS